MDVGVVISHYQVVEHIGRGGMADVWSARDQRLNRMVAIKTIAHGLSSDVDPVRLFEREAQTIAQMEHPHILPIYDFGEFEGQLYIVMRYVTGGSLEDLLERGPLPVADALRMGDAISQALDHAHSNKVIHLDLKPPNILLDSNQAPYLADFGLATVLDPEGRAHNPGSGTLLYMAPEQLTAELIDHRADIYSFSIMLFHMFTGQLPFDATVPLALKQLQYQEDLPEMDIINPDLPYSLTDVLRRGVALDANERPSSLGELMEEVRDVMGATTTVAGLGEGFIDDYPVSDIDAYSAQTESLIGAGDTGLLEAVDLYSRGRHVWAGGNGRFLMGVTHFMLMSGYYRDAEKYGLELDEAGLQMILRGALEYDHDLDYWWAQLDEENQRWVCLHGIRSGTAPARVRSLYRLETLPDDPVSPRIPKLVAQALEVETNEEAKMAALKVLGTRARLVKRSKKFEVQTEFRGRLLSSAARIALQRGADVEWDEAVYSPEIDLLVAETALDQGMPRVAEFAARTVGRMRSVAAVRYIANSQREGRRGALRALALVRDEAPNLPPVVSPQGRLYAWLANTARRLADRPGETALRFVLALLGGWIAMGEQVYITYRSQALFTPQRWGNAIAIGLVFGMFIGLLVLVADEFSRRLEGFWPWWTRVLASGVLGFLVAMLAWAGFQWFFLQQAVTEWDLMRFAGLGLAIGFVLASSLRLRPILAFAVTAAATFIPLLLAFNDFSSMPGAVQVSINHFSVLFYDDPGQIWTVGLPFSIMIALGGFAPLLVGDLRRTIGRPAFKIERPGWLTGMLLYALVVSVVVGVFSLFTLHTDVRWGLMWVAWGAVTFVFAMDAWQWKKWGAYGLLLAFVFLLFGSLAVDLHDAANVFARMRQYIANGSAIPLMPTIFSPGSALWSLWAVAIGIAAFGALRRRLWGGLGLIVMAILWLVVAIFSDLPSNVFVFGTVNLALMAYALGTGWELFGAKAPRPAVVEAPAGIPPVTEPLLIQRPGIAATPAPSVDAGAMKTEFDVAPERGMMETELDAGAEYGARSEPKSPVERGMMATELDPGAESGMRSEPKTPSQRSNMLTELDAGGQFDDGPQTGTPAPWSEEESAEAESGHLTNATELDVSAAHQPDLPETDFRISWKADDSQPKRTELDPNAAPEDRPPAEPKIVWKTDQTDPNRPKTGPLSGKGDEKPKVSWNISTKLPDAEEGKPADPKATELDLGTDAVDTEASTTEEPRIQDDEAGDDEKE